MDSSPGRIMFFSYSVAFGGSVWVRARATSSKETLVSGMFSSRFGLARSARGPGFYFIFIFAHEYGCRFRQRYH